MEHKLELNVRQQAADQNEVDILTQNHAKSQKMILMLTDYLKQTYEQIGTMERSIVDTEHEMDHVEKSLHRKTKSTCYEGKLTEQLTRVNNKLRGLKDDKHQSQADARRAEMLETLKRFYPGVCGRLVDICISIQRNPADVGHSGDWKAHERYCSSASFITLDKIGVKPIDERFRGLGKTSRWSLNVIECESEIEPALHYAVGVTVLCDSIDVARDLFFRQNENGEAVTLNGKVVSKKRKHESCKNNE
ncbi:hypothetical protein PsorP6_014567 [Peronosclerospora sorghi]|uniref:Uncharacterized protein n=1 Tax=Peronosclerospora sorghi TaxID=230839 RepID=A0ACC0VS73_9STRA|nr:hypothetical protein PsorP6_014567 [Peronosclerospora sorghi]